MNPQLLAFFQSNPAFAEEYNRVRAAGDARSAEQWLTGLMAVSPSTAQEFAAFQSAQTNQAVQSGFANHPDLQSAYDAARQTNPNLTPSDFAVQWANAHPNDPRLNDPSFLQSVGLEDDNGPSVPLEQALLNYTSQMGRDDIAMDSQRRADATALLARYAPAFDGARNTIASIYDGSILNSEYGANTEAANSQRTALNTQMDARRAGLDDAIAQLTAAQEPLNAARLDAANTAATGVNLGVQSQRDQIMADFARDGYVGGSTGTDAALARASITGKQQAAEMLGAAKVANAGDTANIGRYGATERRGLVDYGAGEARNISDSEAQRRLGFFSNDVQRRLSSLALPANAVQTEMQVRNMADDYGQSGYQRLMKNLQYFRTQGGSAPTSAPYLSKPLDSGYENLGAGLISVAGNIGNANNWWAKPAAPTGSLNGIPIVNTPETASGAGWFGGNNAPI